MQHSRGIKEAAELFEKFSAEKAEREAANADKMRNRQRGVKPPLYTKIKQNRPFGGCPIYTESEVGRNQIQNGYPTSTYVVNQSMLSSPPSPFSPSPSTTSSASARWT